MSVPLHDDTPVKIGDILAEKYRVERVLGIGGMGVVVAATQLELQRLVAVKFVLPTKANDGEAVERFLREARAAVRLKSEHVAKVLDVGKLETGAPYMVMEFLEGSDLDSVLRGGALEPELAADCIVQACEALAEAHSIGLVHRDLKPHNLFLAKGVGGTSVIKVLDFGISKLIDRDNQISRELTRTTAVLGSPFYMSPEQMRSARKVDARSDIWSLGVILYELLTTHVPWEAESITELAVMVTHEPPTPIETYRKDVPDGLRAVVMKCLQKEPSTRFADAGELATALAPFASGRAIAIAERARNAARLTPMDARTIDLGSGNPPIVAPRIGASTHQTWGDGTPPPRAPSTRLWTWGAIAVVLVAGVAIGIASMRTTPTPPIASPRPIAESVATTVSPKVPTQTTTADTTTSGSGAFSTSSSPSSPPSATSEAASGKSKKPAPWITPKSAPSPSASPSVTLPKPSVTTSPDDEIPPLR